METNEDIAKDIALKYTDKRCEVLVANIAHALTAKDTLMKKLWHSNDLLTDTAKEQYQQKWDIIEQTDTRIKELEEKALRACSNRDKVIKELEAKIAEVIALNKTLIKFRDKSLDHFKEMKKVVTRLKEVAFNLYREGWTADVSEEHLREHFEKLLKRDTLVEKGLPMRTLEFLNPEFHLGNNVTVRKGMKWSDLKPHDKVIIAETGKAPMGTATIIMVITCPLILIPPSILKLEHDPKCRNFLGLKEVMKDTYGKISVDEIVTVLLFSLDAKE